MSKADLKSAMEALNVKVPLRLSARAPSFQSPTPLNESSVPPAASTAREATSGTPDGGSANLEQRGSNSNTVKTEQGQNLTLSKIDTVTAEHCQNRTVLPADPVAQPERAAAQASAKSTKASGFTQVPNEVLRGKGRFVDPLDFMIYLSLLSYSRGFQRDTASMSQGELESFTGAARNTVRKSLERLVQQGWIKMVEDYEFARMSRRWRVYSIGELPPEGSTETTGSNSDTVKNEHCQELTLRGSSLNPVTGSKFDPYIENSSKEKSKKALSPLSEKLQNYFDELKPVKKRESELRAFQALGTNYSEGQIELCLMHLQKNGTPGNREPCHSPMAFLGRAMGQVLDEATREASRQAARSVRQVQQERAEIERLETEAREAQEWARKERTFLEEFPAEWQQHEVLEEFCSGMPFRPESVSGRMIAISRWFSCRSEKSDS